MLYLSMIHDLYDISIVAYKTGIRQTVNLILDTVRLAMTQQKRWPRWTKPSLLLFSVQAGGINASSGG